MLAIARNVATAPLFAALLSCTAHGNTTATRGTSTTATAVSTTQPAHTAVEPLDLDRDGVPNVRDQCPNAPEDRDHVADLDGCPEVDQDCDNIADERDSCPEHPEDHDHWQDQDGCPDPDNDNDRVADVCDACPNEPENYNGNEDDDGCPEWAHIRVSQAQIRILAFPFFERNSSSIRRLDLPILEAVRDALNTNAELLQVAVLGHSSRDERRGAALAQSRAHEVLQWLVNHGVASARLVEHSVGSSRPLDSGATEIGRARNRRVEFAIVQTAERMVLQWNGHTYDAVAPPAEQARPARVRIHVECVSPTMVPIRPGGCPLVELPAEPHAEPQIIAPADSSRDR